jgi:hypothetical protein
MHFFDVSHCTSRALQRARLLTEMVSQLGRKKPFISFINFTSGNFPDSSVFQFYFSARKCNVSCAGILEQSVGARNRVGIGLSTGPTVYIGWWAGTTTRFLAPIECSKIPALHGLSKE